MRPYPLAQLLALPLQSAVRAQGLALQETLSVLEGLGLENGKVKTFRFKAERMVEERTVNPTTGLAETRSVVQPFEVSVPLLALAPVSPVQLQEMNVDLAVEVVQPKPEPIRSVTLPTTVVGSSLANSLSVFTSLGETKAMTMKVHMRIVKETPEGIARVRDLLTDLLSAATVPTVDQIPGLPRDTVDALKTRGIHAVSDFLGATDAATARGNLAVALGVSVTHIETWRREAGRIVRSEEGPP